MDEKLKSTQKNQLPNSRAKKKPVIESYKSWLQKVKESPSLQEDIANKDNLGGDDDLYRAALKIVTETRNASISFIQRQLGITYTSSQQLVELMEKNGIVSEKNDDATRTVLVETASGESQGASSARKPSRRSRR